MLCSVLSIVVFTSAAIVVAVALVAYKSRRSVPSPRRFVHLVLQTLLTCLQLERGASAGGGGGTGGLGKVSGRDSHELDDVIEISLHTSNVYA